MSLRGSTSFSSSAWPNTTIRACAHKGRRSMKSRGQSRASRASHSAGGASSRAPFSSNTVIASRTGPRTPPTPARAISPACNSLSLFLASGSCEPAQAVEEIVQVLACGTAGSFEDVLLVGHGRGQFLRAHKSQRCRGMGVQRLVQRGSTGQRRRHPACRHRARARTRARPCPARGASPASGPRSPRPWRQVLDFAGPRFGCERKQLGVLLEQLERTAAAAEQLG